MRGTTPRTERATQLGKDPTVQVSPESFVLHPPPLKSSQSSPNTITPEETVSANEPPPSSASCRLLWRHRYPQQLRGCLQHQSGAGTSDVGVVTERAGEQRTIYTVF